MPGKCGLFNKSLLIVFSLFSLFSIAAVADDNLVPLAEASHTQLLTRGVDALNEPVSSVIHPSGNYAFVAERTGDAISVFKISETRLSHVQTFRDGDTGAENLNGVVDLAISSDGKFLYAASLNDDAISVFVVDQSNGKLSPLTSYVSGGQDALGVRIEGLSHFTNAGINDIALSPSGSYLAVTNSWSGGAVFRRDPATGRLTFLRRSFPGYSLGNNYVTFGQSDQELILLNSMYDDVVVFSMSNTGTLTRTQLIDNGKNGITGLDGPVSALFRNGFLYVSSSSSRTLSVLSKGVGTAYAKIQEIAVGAVEPTGAQIIAVRDPGSIAVGLEGQYLYLSSKSTDSIAAFLLGATDGRLTPAAQTTSLVGALDGVANLSSIPGVPWLLGVAADGSSLQLFSERLQFPKKILKITQPDLADYSMLESDVLELKGYAWHITRGEITNEIKWYDQTGALLGSGRSIVVRNRGVGSHVITAQFHVPGILMEDKLNLTVRSSGNGVPLVISKPPLTASVGVVYEYRLEAIDDGAASDLRYSLVSGPAGLLVSAAGLVSWTPVAAQIGFQPVVIRVTDQAGAYSDHSFAVEVKQSAANYAISFVSTPSLEIPVGVRYQYDANAITNSGAELRYYLQVGPEGMTIDEKTGVLNWISKVTDIGLNPVSIRALDGFGNSAEQSFAISVPQGQLPPEIVSVPDFNAPKNQQYSYALQVTPPNSPYSYSVASSAQGASIDAGGILHWQPSVDYLETLANENKYCGTAAPELGAFDPALKWHWNEGQVRNPPLVAQFNDDNGDGTINYLDHPDVAFIAYTGKEYGSAWLEVLDGATGLHLSTFARPAEYFSGYGQIAVGDINNDGLIEIVGTTNDRYLVAFSVRGGAPLWKKPIPAAVSLRNHVGFYDLNADGRTEILAGKAVFDLNGNLRWVVDTPDSATGGTISFGIFDSRAPNEDQLSYAAELDESSPGLEVVLGHEVYSASGVKLWQGEGYSSGAGNVHAANGFSAVADLDNDGDPELVVVSTDASYVVAYETGGKRIWGYLSQTGDAGGPPTIGDIDGDGFVEIAFVRRNYITVLNHDGTLLWQAPIQETSSGITGSTIFDFEGDGEAELLYGDEQFLRAYDKTGAVKYQIPNISGTWTEYPVIADIDNDGHADILMPSSDSGDVTGEANTTRGVRVFSDAQNSWAGTRAIWNQHVYHIDNINDDGSIPRVPVQSYTTHNTFRVSSYSGATGMQQVDLALVDLRLQEQQGEYHLLVDLLNRTALPVFYGFDVNAYHGSSEGGQLIASRHTVGVKPSERLILDLGRVDPSLWAQDITAQIHIDGQKQECSTANNTLKAAFFAVTARDGLSRSDTQYFLVSVSEFNTPPEIISVPPITTIKAATSWTYYVLASDQNIGDSLQYALVDPPSGMKIDQFTGKISWRPSVSAVGNHDVNIMVRDISGNAVEQNFSLVVERNTDVNNPPHFVFADYYEVPRNSYFRMAPTVVDDEGSVVSIEAVNVPSNARLLEGTNEVYWYASTPGVYEFTLRATDNQGLSGLGKFYLWVTNVATTPDDGINPPELVTLPPIIAFVAGQSNQYALPMPDTSAGYHYQLTSRPSGLTLNNNILSWTPPVSAIGEHAVRLEMSNGTFSYQYSLTVDVRQTINRPPDVVTTGFPGLLYANEPMRYTFAVSDPDGDDVRFRIISMPTGMTLDGTTVNWVPAVTDDGHHTLTLEVNDGVSYVLTVDLSFDVRLVHNRPPRLTQFDAPHFASIGYDYRYQFSAYDPDGDSLVYEVVNAPPGMMINQNGLLTMNPIPVSALGDYQVTVRVTDGHGGSGWITLPVRVDYNHPPQLANQPSTAAFVGREYVYGLRATDTEGMPITYSLVGTPDGMAINSAGSLRWTPTADQVGSHAINILMTDSLGESTTLTFDLVVYTDQILYRKVCAAESL